MKVLVPLPFDVSLQAHGRNLRIVHLLRELNSQCDLNIITADDRVAAAARSVLPELRIAAAGSVVDRFGPVTPKVVGSYWLNRALAFSGSNSQLARAIIRQAVQADVVLGFDMPSVSYLLAVAGQVEGRPRIVLDLIDDPRRTWQSLPLIRRLSPAGIKTAVCNRIILREAMRAFDAVIAITPDDATILSRATGLEVAIVPNGVNVSYHPNDEQEREPLVVFTGAMNFPPNESAAGYLVRRIWPHVLRRCNHQSTTAKANKPDASAIRLPKLAIVGANPTPKVRRLARHASVVVTGRVDDVSHWLSRARVAVAPMISGCGMKNKVLEACAAGCPVVSTPLGAAGLPTGKKHGIIVAQSPEQIGEEISQLLADASAGRILGLAGLAMVQERFSWSQSADKLLDFLSGGSRWIEKVANQATSNSPKLPCVTTLSSKGQHDDKEALIHAAS